MNPVNRLSEYVARLQRRLAMLSLARGAAITAAAALLGSVAAVLAANYFAFSDPSVMWARFFLFLTLALALGLGIVIPLIQLNRRRSAREAERQIPEFEERLLTFAERVEDGRRDPFLELLAADTLTVADHAEPERVARRSWIASFATAAACAILALVWLATS